MTTSTYDAAGVTLSGTQLAGVTGLKGMESQRIMATGSDYTVVGPKPSVQPAADLPVRYDVLRQALRRMNSSPRLKMLMAQSSANTRLATWLNQDRAARRPSRAMRRYLVNEAFAIWNTLTPKFRQQLVPSPEVRNMIEGRPFMAARGPRGPRSYRALMVDPRREVLYLRGDQLVAAARATTPERELGASRTLRRARKPGQAPSTAGFYNELDNRFMMTLGNHPRHEEDEPKPKGRHSLRLLPRGIRYGLVA